MVFSIFTELCNYHHYFHSQNISITPKRNSIPISVTPPFLLPPSPRQLLVCSSSYGLAYSGYFLYMEYVTFVSGFFHLA